MDLEALILFGFSFVSDIYFTFFEVIVGKIPGLYKKKKHFDMCIA